MTRHHRDQRPKKKGGLLMGMRQGVKTVAAGVAGNEPSRTSKWVWNIITGVLVLVAAAFLLRRFGVIHF